jgi:predicted phage gp36 major capsid-like protein
MIKVRSSGCSPLFTGRKGGLTDKQREKLFLLKIKVKLTEKQAEERDELEKKAEMSDDLARVLRPTSRRWLTRWRTGTRQRSAHER